MAELLIRTISRTSDDPIQDQMLSKRGDVITVEPDNHGWGAEELTAEYWTIVKIPGVPAEDFQDLLMPQISKDFVTLSRRAKAVNLDDAILAPFLTQRIVTLSTPESLAAFNLAKFDKPVVENPVTLS